ncbi:hypothetical protein HRD49_38200 [Corallococcus exiguus]|nr:hypothetical protein [Corallococcus exiguus]NRD67582.1 hypothetical protein [Corallococcus exiguus]RKH22320.1 hypothetical protein D7V77_27365 [Corallococcus sp. CA041A]RUO89054.1 hypothetical protein D7Y11_32210 [Corallococcus sp. AB018]
MARMLMSSVVMVALFTAAPAPKSQPLTWKVTGSDVTFEMSSKDLRALRGGKEVFGLLSRKKGFLEDLKPDPEETRDMSDWEAYHSFKVLSVVGPWASYEESSSGYTGGAHPYAHSGYVTWDVTKEHGAFNLLDVFPEKDVLQALKADSFVKEHIDDAKAFNDAKTVAGLMEILKPGEDCVGFNSSGLDNVKRSVAFHHVEGDKVAVRIAFAYDNESCRGNMFVVGVLLPIPEALKPALERARTRQEGFLMKDARSAKAPSLSFEWEGADAKKP